MSGAFSFLHRKKEKAQYVKVLVKDEGVRGEKKETAADDRLFLKSFVFSPVRHEGGVSAYFRISSQGLRKLLASEVKTLKRMMWQRAATPSRQPIFLPSP